MVSGNPIFTDEEKAREWLEAQVWPHGPTCPHCGSVERLTRMQGQAHRAGVFQCNSCRQQFTVTVGTVCERSKIPLTKWLMAIFLISASKKGMSALQLSRILGLSYQSTWFLMHRIREAMAEGKLPGSFSPLALLWQFRFDGVGEEFLTMRTSPGWRLCEEVEDGLPDGRHAWLWRRSSDSFFSVPLL